MPRKDATNKALQLSMLADGRTKWPIHSLEYEADPQWEVHTAQGMDGPQHITDALASCLQAQFGIRASWRAGYRGHGTPYGEKEASRLWERSSALGLSWRAVSSALIPVAPAWRVTQPCRQAEAAAMATFSAPGARVARTGTPYSVLRIPCSILRTWCVNKVPGQGILGGFHPCYGLVPTSLSVF